MTHQPRLEQRVAKWRRWLEGQMRNEILTMNLHRSFWQQTREIIVANETLPPSSWWEFISDLYGSSQASAVRRLVDPHDNGVSLRRVLDEMMQEPHLLTFHYFIGLIPPQPPSLVPRMRAWWRDHFAGDVDTHIDPAIVSADLDELTTTTAPVVAHVDRHIAHSDPRPVRPGQLATLAEVHASIDAIGSLFQRYRTLLTGHTGGGLTPVIMDNWQAIFRQPWIT
jgi:hypothetical protein